MKLKEKSLFPQEKLSNLCRLLCVETAVLWAKTNIQSAAAHTEQCITVSLWIVEICHTFPTGLSKHLR